jgi:aspartate aminotransferase
MTCHRFAGRSWRLAKKIHFILFSLECFPMPTLSEHIRSRNPSAIRLAGIRFAGRRDGTRALNVAIGNVSLPMHPAMTRRLHGMAAPESPFCGGVVRYTPTVGLDETRQAFLNILGASGLPTRDLHVLITDGGSQAMALVILACCGPAGTTEAPLFLIDAAYPNYKSFAERLGRATVSFSRMLEDDGRFTLPRLEKIGEMLSRHRPGALVVIPYDNPTGQYYDHQTMVQLARLCVEHDLWMVSDEAYRELYYTGGRPTSIWAISEEEAPGITGRRISIETASKVWNGCGLRIGALVTDNLEMHTRCEAENTANLCSNAPGQWVFGALAELSHEELRAWFHKQREYYRPMMEAFAARTRELLPGVVVGLPSAALYTVVDLRRLVGPDFDSQDFVMWCAEEGVVDLDGEPWTLLMAPMPEFYSALSGADNPGRTQMRVAFVETPEIMARVPVLLAALLQKYLKRPSLLREA